MCQFFSFLTDIKGNKYYLDAKQREELLKSNPDEINPDSHSSIAAFFKLNEDKLNKYEYNKGELIVDQLNTEDDSKSVKRWVKKFADSDEFQDICLAAVKQRRLALEYVKDDFKHLFN